MSDPLRVLLIEDSPTDAKLVIQELRKMARPIEFDRVDTAEAMRAALEKMTWDVVLSDWSMPKFSAPAALVVLKEMQLYPPFIIVSGTIGEDMAADAMRAGAHDYVLKDKLGRLVPAVLRELRECTERAERRKTEDALKKSEERLRHAQKMEAVGRLAGGIAHDFNNVLSVIFSYGELILADLKPGDPLRDDIEEIRKAAARAAGLTRQLLMFSRQEVAEPKVLDLNEVLANMHKMLSRILGEDIELVSRTEKSVGNVKVDPSHIEQVVMNLVVNARDAMPKGGKLTIEVANAVLDAAPGASPLSQKGGAHVALSVTDTGCGMDATTVSHIFEPFFTTKEKGKGTGLGLSTVFGIVQQSGGDVRVRSEPAKGTTFTIYLPKVDASTSGARVPAPPATLRGSETILLVEDEEQVRTIVVTALRRQGYQVLPAQNGGEALLLCEKHEAKIDLLLTDVVMPKMSGPDLAKRLVALRPEMKVLCMSGYTDDSIVRHGVLENALPFLQKPFTPASLARKVREVLDGAIASRT